MQDHKLKKLGEELEKSLRKTGGKNWVREKALPMLVKMARVIKALDTERKEEGAPGKAIVDEVNGEFQPVIKGLGVADRILRDEVLERHEGTNVVTGEEGELVFVEKWEYEVTDEGALPEEFMTVDHGAIKEEIKMGVRTISGVKITMGRILQVRPAK